MKNIKRKLAMVAAAGAVAVTGAVASPQSASANSGDRVCLSSNSATYSYLRVQYLFNNTNTYYVNRGQCSSTVWNRYLYRWGIATGFQCYDTRTGTAYFDRTWYQDGGGHNLKCKVNGGSW